MTDQEWVAACEQVAIDARHAREREDAASLLNKGLAAVNPPSPS